VLRPEVGLLNQRIDQRLDMMVQTGALDEVRANLGDWDAGAPWAQAIGAADFVACLRGTQSLADAVQAAKTATHQYAKRQRTWQRSRMADWQQYA
jgi:tRNA dimethylallyltransferase